MNGIQAVKAYMVNLVIWQIIFSCPWLKNMLWEIDYSRGVPTLNPDYGKNPIIIFNPYVCKYSTQQLKFCDVMDYE